VVVTPVASVGSLQTSDLLPAPSATSRGAAINTLRGARTGGLVACHTDAFTAAGSEPLDTFAPDREDTIEARAVNDAVLHDRLPIDAPVGIRRYVDECGVMLLVLTKRDVRAVRVHQATGHIETAHIYGIVNVLNSESVVLPQTVLESSTYPRGGRGVLRVRHFVMGDSGVLMP